MEQANLRRIADFVWAIANDVLRDVYVRAKYRDVILSMVVIRRLDTVPEPTKDAVLAMKTRLDEMPGHRPALCRRPALLQRVTLHPAEPA